MGRKETERRVVAHYPSGIPLRRLKGGFVQCREAFESITDGKKLQRRVDRRRDIV